jgi:hypothetical protein
MQLVFSKDCSSISAPDRIVVTLKWLPAMSLITFTLDILAAFGLCPAVGLSAAIVATRRRRWQQGV